MAKPKKDGKFVNIYMDIELSKRLDNYYDETGIPKTTIIEKALKEYLDKKEKKHD